MAELKDESRREEMIIKLKEIAKMAVHRYKQVKGEMIATNKIAKEAGFTIDQDTGEISPIDLSKDHFR